MSLNHSFTVVRVSVAETHPPPSKTPAPHAAAAVCVLLLLLLLLSPGVCVVLQGWWS